MTRAPEPHPRTPWTRTTDHLPIDAHLCVAVWLPPRAREWLGKSYGVVYREDGQWLTADGTSSVVEPHAWAYVSDYYDHRSEQDGQ